MSSEDAEIRQNLLLLFERPLEPVSVPKGPRKQVFDLPEDYQAVERYQPSTSKLRTGTKGRIRVKKIHIPDLSLPMALGRRDNFSLFIPYHCKMASALINALMSQPTLADFLSLSVYARERINPFLFIYAYSVAILHRKDTKTIPLPSFAEVFPEKYLDCTVFSSAREEATNEKDASKRKPVEIFQDFTASDLNVEHRLAYFREDLGINLHHWHWHLVYPNVGDLNIVKKDRRGELFYYMHQQILARYNCERFSNNLGRTKRLLNWRDPIPEGYFPKLDNLIASRVWPPRTSNTILSDVNREVHKLKFDIQDMERFRDRFYHAIHTGSVVTADGSTLQLDDVNGIDILGNMMESSVLSVNPNLYGDLHNMGHIVIAVSHDPDFRHLEDLGIMGDTTTAMRDPVFYRWHAFVDDIFQKHKNHLTPYSDDQVFYNKIQVTSAQIKVQGHPDNQLLTLWQKSDIDLGNGFDFQADGNVFVRITHLQHIPFSYRITVENHYQDNVQENHNDDYDHRRRRHTKHNHPHHGQPQHGHPHHDHPHHDNHHYHNDDYHDHPHHGDHHHHEHPHHDNPHPHHDHPHHDHPHHDHPHHDHPHHDHPHHDHPHHGHPHHDHPHHGHPHHDHSHHGHPHHDIPHHPPPHDIPHHGHPHHDIPHPPPPHDIPHHDHPPHGIPPADIPNHDTPPHDTPHDHQQLQQQRKGTCRIFLAPKFDERGIPLLFREQKGLFIEMDKFTVNLQPGTNVIERKSKDSSVTIPFERTFPNKKAGSQTEGTPVDDNFCGCGWPEHMLVPRGTPAGLPCQLFVMISNYEEDFVERSDTGGKMCTDIASSYCGLRDDKYPDKRAMGYPFDRLPPAGVNTLQEFLTPNMAVVDVTIKHLFDKVITPEQPGVNDAEDALKLI